MTTPSMPHVECDQQHPVLAVTDVTAAADFYARNLGFIQAFVEGDLP